MALDTSKWGREDLIREARLQTEAIQRLDVVLRLGYTRSRMTRILDSLSAKGYVRRAADSHDRRRVTAFATEKGRKFSREQRAEGVNDLAARLTTLGEHDTKELLRVLEKAYSITYDRDRIVEDEEPGRD